MPVRTVPMPQIPWSEFPFFTVIDDHEFIELAPHGTSFAHFDNKLFNPLLMTKDNFRLQDHDHETDKLINKCQYFTLETINQKLNSNRNTEFSIIHANVRSLPKNKWKLENLIANFDKQISIIALSETWLTKINEKDFENFGNYKGYFKSRNKQGGGVGFFINKNFKIKERKDLKFNNNNSDALTVELIQENAKNILLTVIYKPPNENADEFNHDLEVYLSLLSREDKISYCAGDFNFDLFKTGKHQATEDFYNNMLSHNHVPLIYKATRVTSTSATLIDNIFTNDPRINLTGIIIDDISDHFPIFATTNKTIKNVTKIKVRYRKMDENAINNFINVLKDHSWESVMSQTNVNNSYDTFEKIILDEYESCFPLKDKTITKYNNNIKPWITAGIIISTRTKSKLYKKYLRNPTLIHETNYRNFNKILKKTITLSQKEYYRTKFQSAEGNIKENWKIINELLNRNKSNTTSNNTFVYNEKTISDKQEIANSFNSFFSKIGQNLANKIPNSNKSPIEFLQNLEKQANSLFIQPIVEDELKKILSKLKDSAAGFDEIKPIIIRYSNEHLFTPLLFILNQSLQSGIFPEKLKIAKVTPIFKKGEHNLFTNYRPISVLSVFSKILEKIMYSRLMSFITQYEILYLNQFGFREKRSTSMAILTFVEKIRKSLDNKELCIGLFLDFAKAFDTINHKILFEKLDFYGIRGIALDWVKSYFKDRKQLTIYENKKSTLENITCGVPQGSVLGPLFFIIYINDIHLTSDKLFFVLFADDTNILINDKDPLELQNTLNTELKKIESWLTVNKLSLNIEKTKYIIFSSPRRIPNYNNIKIYFYNKLIERVNSTTFLGVIIDKHLKWKEHIQSVRLKLSRILGILYKIKHLLNLKTFHAIYYSLFFSYLNYCNTIWAGANITTLNCLYISQKKFVRITTNSDYRAHSAPLFKQLKIINIFDIHRINLSIFLYKWENNIDHYKIIYPNFFRKHHELHRYNTRNKNDYIKPKPSNQYGIKSISYSAPDIWNDINNDIKLARSPNELKNKMKKHYLNQYI